jgi:hypothetical protein
MRDVGETLNLGPGSLSSLLVLVDDRCQYLKTAERSMRLRFVASMFEQCPQF